MLSQENIQHQNILCLKLFRSEKYFVAALVPGQAEDDGDNYPGDELSSWHCPRPRSHSNPSSAPSQYSLHEYCILCTCISGNSDGHIFSQDQPTSHSAQCQRGAKGA